MQNELTCSQVIALVNFYIEDKLTPKLRGLVDAHLQHCENCRKLYYGAADTLNKFQNNIPTNYTKYETPQYFEFIGKLSAYIDNELDEHDSVKMKKIAITNPLARQDLENMYTFKRLMHNSFNRTKSEWKNDYVKLIMKELGKEPVLKFGFSKLVYSFVFLLTLIIFGLFTTIKF